jgi:hypothetical protein
MDNQPKKEKKISRRSLLPILGSTLLIPFLGLGKTEKDGKISLQEEEEFQILLKPDGTTVKVKLSALKKSKVIKKNISNTTFLDWLGKKL